MPSVAQDHLSVPSSSSSSWHQISPSTRPLNLEILEITALTLTIALSLAPRPRSQQFRQLSHRPSQSQLNGAYASNQSRSRKGSRARGRSAESDDELTAVADNDAAYPSSSSSMNGVSQSGGDSTDSPGFGHGGTVPGTYATSPPTISRSSSTPHPSFKDLLAKGVVVTVNGKPWTMIVAHVDEDDHFPSTSGDFDDLLSPDTTSASPALSRASSTGKTRRKSEDPEESAGTGDGSGPGMVNGAAIRPEMDRAIVVIYGLEPGHEYEVDLKVIGNLNNGEPHPALTATASATIVTPAVHAGIVSGNRSRANSLRSRPNGTRSRSNSLIQPVALTSSATIGGGRTPPDGTILLAHGDGNLSASPAALRRHSREVSDGVGQDGAALNGGPIDRPGQEDIRANHLRHLVQTANAEKEDLAAQLKKSRRESQKAEASLRSDIEALKKAMEKTTLPDQRSRQKLLALQEQVKQALAGAGEADKEQRSIDQGMGHLAAQERDVKGEWEQAQEEREKASGERDRVIEETRRSIADVDSELAAINAKLEKQLAKRDRILRENQDLQQKLEDVASARAEVEKRNESIVKQRSQGEEYPNGQANITTGRPVSGTSGPWDTDDVWTVNPAAASRPNAGRGSIGAAAGSLPFVNQGGLPMQSSYSSTDLHQLGRLSGPSYNARPFWPSNLAMPRATSGPSMPPVAVAALATQGIPKAATMGVSHLGNPTGFFPAAPVSSASSAAAALSRTYNARPGTAGISGIGTTSPLVANVNAVPFTPSQQPLVNHDSSRQSSSSSDQHTSLVPPQLQHRIFLPGNRRVASPGSVGSGNIAANPTYTAKEPNSAGELSQTSPTLAPPSFPPLPSSKPAAATTVSYKPGSSPGPSLASIVTRAIIPSNSVLHTGHQASQKSPVHQHSDVLSSHYGARPSPPSSRPTSYYGKLEAGESGLGRALGGSHTQESDQFPPLPISPLGAWGSSSAASGAILGNGKGACPAGAAGSGQQALLHWAGKVQNRRASDE